MKFIKGFIRFIFSAAITIVLTTTLIFFGICISSASTLTQDNISKAIKSTMSDIGDMITTFDKTDEEAKNDVAQVVTEVLEEVGISQEQATVLFTNEDIKVVISDLTSSVIMHEIDGITPIILPSEEKTVEIFENNLEEIAPIFGINPEDVDKEGTVNFIHENYDSIMDQLDSFLEQYGGAMK